MFTGLIEEVGKVLDIVVKNDIWTITIECEKIVNNISIGDSVAVNGVCLTVKEFNSNSFKVDVMAETIRKTNIEFLKIDSKVNLERALRVGDRLGGHMVSGHIDGIGVIEGFEKEGDAIQVSVSATGGILKYVVYKGSVAIDGISLTVNYVDDEIFKVSIIPHTKEVTTLTKKKVKDLVNIECDVVGKYIEKFLKYKDVEDESSIDMKLLKENGFI